MAKAPEGFSYVPGLLTPQEQREASNSRFGRLLVSLAPHHDPSFLALFVRRNLLRPHVGLYHQKK